MSAPQTFNSTVAARTRAAAEILRVPEYLANYVQAGGRAEDLTKVVDLGQRAELLHQEQSQTRAAGGAATETVQVRFEAVRGEYSKVMAAVQAVEKDLIEAGAPVEVVRAVRQILANESERVLLPADGEAAPGESPRRRSVRSRSQEALRAEIQKDTGALIQLEAAHEALAERKVDRPRLDELHRGALELTGQLAVRVTRKGKAKGTTQSLRGMVTEQRRVWGTIYRLLRLAGQADPRIKELLADTRKR
jgi:hypothetical protein